MGKENSLPGSQESRNKRMQECMDIIEGQTCSSLPECNDRHTGCWRLHWTGMYAYNTSSNFSVSHMKKILDNPGWGRSESTKWIDKEKFEFIWDKKELTFIDHDESEIYCPRCDCWLFTYQNERYKYD